MKTSAIRQIFTILLLLICTYPRVFATTAQLPPPAITSISPVSGGVGTLVTITGTELSNPTAFSIGGVPAIVISNTGTSLVGMVMPGATTGVVSVTTDNGTVNSVETFAVTPTGYPNAQQGSKLVGTGAIGTSRQGYSISLSADGNTAIVGGEGDDGGNGAIWVFTRSNGVWSQQGDKLVGTGATGGAGQGGSVSLSADGNTAIVGGVGDNLGKGAAWVFIRYNGVWNQQGDKLIGVDATSEDVTSLGVSVSLSADGNTAIVGGGGDDSGKGAAWIFTRSNGVWSQQGTKLVGSGATGFARQGSAVSISADGNTVVVGGPLDDGNIGAAWVFTRSNGFWSQQGNKLVGTGAINSSSTGNAMQGSSVSLSADGNTAIVGGEGDDGNNGAVWVYTRSNNQWSQQGAKLVGAGAIGLAYQGASVSLSADGNTAIVGGGGDDGNKGAAWVYRRSNGAWSQLGAKLIGANVTGYQIIYNNSVSIAADGSTAILGTPGDDEMSGASFIFTPGLITSNNSITYDGNGNTSGTVPASQIATAGSTVTLAVNTGNLAKTGYVFAGWNTAADGSGSNYVAGTDCTLTISFTLYARWEIPLPAITSISPVSGRVGTLVTITGTELSNPTAFSIGGVPAIVISNTGTSLVGMVMPGATTGFVSVTTDYGTADSDQNFTVTSTSYPNVQQGSKLVGTGATGGGQGRSVAISADGNTAIIGGYGDNGNNGAVWVYTLSNGSWIQQGAKLVGSGAIGAARQGLSVSIAADGNTAIVGGDGDNGGIGAAWIFTRSNDIWIQQGDKLVGSGAIGTAFQGRSVSLSANGNVAIVGGAGDDGNKGAAWVFSRSNGVWSQQGGKLLGTGATGIARQGFSVSLSAEGNTAIIGGQGDDGNKGAAWVFTQLNGVWSQQGSKLVGSAAIGAAYQGWSVALSADGNTAIVGGGGDDGNKSAAWIYTRSNGVWSQQGNKLVGIGATGASFPGNSVSLSADGNTAILGINGDENNNGAIWVYTRSNEIWSQQVDKLTGIGAVGAGYQGRSVSLSADGTSVIVGGDYDDGFIGAAWVFTTGIKYNGNGYTSGSVPASQNAITGSSVTLAGNTGNLAKTGYVFAGWNTAADGSGTNYAAGVDYTFTSSLTLYARWELPTPTITSISPVSGSVGTLVTITGTDLSNPTAFSIGGVPAIVISNTGTSLVGMVMPGATTGVVSVTTDNGTADSDQNFTVTPTTYPIAQQGAKLVGTGAEGPLASASQGYSVSLSADGNTALIGGALDDLGKGAVWVYTRSNNIWSQQGAKLVGTGAAGTSFQGSSVSLSADGNTAIIGGFGDNGFKGAAWIYTRSNDIWSQQGAKLVGVGASDSAFLGISVSLSADGNTAIVGAPGDDGNKGAVWIYRRSNGIWSQGTKVIGTGALGAAQQGGSVFISADGNTALVGGEGDDSGVGAAWVYSRLNQVLWTQQGSKLVGQGATEFATQGYSVSLSADGNTAIVGGPGDDLGKGAVWVFTRSNGVWSQQGNKLVCSDTIDGSADVREQGRRVSLSGDGNLAIIGGFNGDIMSEAWVFTRANGVWSQRDTKFVPTFTVGAFQGQSVSLSTDGTTVIFGDQSDEGMVGAAWVFTTGISYNGNGNTSGTAPESQTASTGSSVTLAGNTGNLAKAGNVFAGWNTAADGNGTSYAEGDVYAFTGSLTLYAQWLACNASYFDTTIRVKPNELPLSWNGNTIDATGIYRDTLQNSTGCDSIVSLQLQVLPEFEYTTPASFKVNETIQPLEPISSGSAIRGYYGKVVTVAGQSQSGFLDGNNNLALFNAPTGVVADSAGNIYVSDRNNHAIRKIDNTGTVSSFAGSLPGYKNSFGVTDGWGSSAKFSAPEGLAIDKEGNIYVADQANHAIRKISPAGSVTTIAGTGNSGQIDGAVDSATFNLPSAVAVDSKGNIYVADTYNNRIRKISTDGLVTTIAGNGSAGNQDGPGSEAAFSNPAGIYVDVFDNIYVSEELNHQIRKIDKYSMVSTIAGNSQPGFAEGNGAEVQFFYPRGIIGDEAGNLLIADMENNVVRKLGVDNYVSLFAGNGIASSENSDMLTSTFNRPIALAVDTINKRILVTEQMGHNVRSIQYSGFSIFPDLPEGLSLDSLGNIKGTATQVSPLTNYMVIGTNAFGADTAFVDLEITAADSFAVALLDKTDINGCAGDSTGAINIQVSGNQGNVTFEWTSPADPSFTSTQQHLADLKAGIYHLVARDSSGNIDSIDVELLQPDALVLEGFADNAYCNGDSSGYLGISYGGGTPKEGDLSYDVLWNFGGTEDVYYNAAPGVYSVTVTDANGCSAEVSNLIVDEPPVISLAFNVTDVLCNGDSTGTLKVIASGGTVSSSGSSAYSYLWGNGSTDFNLSGLKVGVYAVTVKDDFLCSTSGSYEVKQPQALSMVTQPKAVSCFGGADGSVLINVTGGVRPYMYKVDSSNFISANSFSGLTKGFHQAV